MCEQRKLRRVCAGFSLTFVFQESLGLPSVVFESPWTYFKSPSDSFTILGLWVLGLALYHINDYNCKVLHPGTR